ncbi:MAG TPA: class I SAM-dependent methyltransferase, partial [Gemmatimonadaceae bacterium]|nr:class I SAM-dependent methyltransferase [Gemmatimonadaceae bacterium]
DFNPSYIESARQRTGREFIVADVTKYEVAPDERFDLILANSLFHHIDDASTRRILAHLATLLSPDGHVHIFDLVLPSRPSVSRFLARADRGDFPRPIDEWRELFTDAFEPVVFEPYPLGAGGITLWNMIYFKGRARR